MKRIFIKMLSFVLVIVACLSAASCAQRLAIDGENMNWQLVFITKNSAANIMYCAAQYKENYPKADVLDLSCRASDGKFMIIDEKNGMSYTGIYSIDNDSRDVLYDIVMTGEDGAIDGHAEITRVKLHDDTIEYNLIIEIDGYTLHFKSI